MGKERCSLYLIVLCGKVSYNVILVDASFPQIRP